MKENLNGFRNGTALSSLVAAGIGSLTFGILIILAEKSPQFVKPHLTLDKGVGPLSGKTTYAILVYFLSWAILSFLWRKKHLDESKYLRISFVLIVIALVLSFPPLYELFTS
jgi:hypothetical protein